MSISQDDVIEILRLLDNSEFEELQLKMGDLELIVNKFSQKNKHLTPMVKNEISGIRNSSLAESNEKLVLSTFENDNTALENQEGLIPIKSPMLGTFYRSSGPGEPPFVDIGSEVNEDSTICIIEVMKLFSTICAGTHGRIERILAEDGKMVEYNQVLFLVDPDINKQEI
jgi:acetyl-CoA carboxylase biotin carboxyl carrier protein